VELKRREVGWWRLMEDHRQNGSRFGLSPIATHSSRSKLQFGPKRVVGNVAAAEQTLASMLQQRLLLVEMDNALLERLQGRLIEPGVWDINSNGSVTLSGWSDGLSAAQIGLIFLKQHFGNLSAECNREEFLG
jgi:hypothetical protein